MTQYNTLNIKLSNSQLNKLKSRIKSGTEGILNLLSNVSTKSNEDNNFPHRLLLTDRPVLKPRKAFANNKSTNIKLSKPQPSKTVQVGRFIGTLLYQLRTSGLPLIKNVLKPLTKSVLIPLQLTAAASAEDARIQKQILGSEVTTLVISNEEMNHVMKIVKFLKESALLIKIVSKTIKNKAK